MGQAAMDTIRSLIKKVTVGPINAEGMAMMLVYMVIWRQSSGRATWLEGQT